MTGQAPSSARRGAELPRRPRREALRRALARADRALTSLPHAKDDLAPCAPASAEDDPAAYASSMLGRMLDHVRLPAWSPRVEVRVRGEDEAFADRERIVIAPGVATTTIGEWMLAQYVAWAVQRDLAVDADLEVVGVALGLGVQLAGPARSERARLPLHREELMTDGELGWVLALRSSARGDDDARWAALARSMRPSVRGVLERAHVLSSQQPDVHGVPLPLRRRWLSDRLAELGPTSLRVLEPTKADFPEAWRGDEASVRRLAERLLAHVGLGGRRVVIETFDEKLRGLAHTGHDTPAWFEHIDDERAVFGVRSDMLARSEDLAGVMAHEIAHAYRHAHELVVPDRDDEEERTDVTTVFLGLGLLTANASDRFEAGMTAPGTSRWTHSGIGYLDTEDFAWLLAVRDGSEPRRLDRWASHLGPRQRDALRAARALRSGRGGDLVGRSPLLFWVALVGLPLLLVGLLVWARTEPLGASCAPGRPCRFFFREECVEDRCVAPCSDDASCVAGQACTPFFDGYGTRRFCVRRRHR